MATGTVKWFDQSRSFGFIAPDGGGKDLFVHRSNVREGDAAALGEGSKVEFEVSEGPKGLEATQVATLA